MASITTINSGDLISTSRTDINNNFSSLNANKIETSVLDTDNTLAANSDLKIPSQKALKTYIDVGGNVNASETTKGIAEEATDAEVTAGIATGGTGAKLFVTPAKLATASSETAASKLAKIKSTGLLDASIIPGSQQTMGVRDNAIIKLWYNVKLLFQLWTGAVANDTTTTFVNWNRTDATKVVIPAGGNVASFRSTGSAQLWLDTPFYGATSTPLAFSDSHTLILDFFARFISGAGQNMMGFGLLNEFINLSTTIDRSIFFNFQNGVIFATTGRVAAIETTDVGAGITETNWNNYRIEWDGTNDVARFYINGVLVKSSSGVTIPITGDIQVGFGRNITNPVLFEVMAPDFAIKLI